MGHVVVRTDLESTERGLVRAKGSGNGSEPKRDPPTTHSGMSCGENATNSSAPPRRKGRTKGWTFANHRVQSCPEGIRGYQRVAVGSDSGSGSEELVRVGWYAAAQGQVRPREVSCSLEKENGYIEDGGCAARRLEHVLQVA